MIILRATNGSCVKLDELLTPAQMSKADQLTIQAGTPGFELMHKAGSCVSEEILKQYPNHKNILILCGLGNNGGDGFVVAEKLVEQGKNVHILILGDRHKISGDANIALSSVPAEMILDKLPDLSNYDLLVDAILGTGLDRPVSDQLAATIDRANQAGAPIVSVDLPSGIDGKTGRICGTAVKAQLTVTFFRRKLGHLLLPGRFYCGDIRSRQIGIGEDVLENCGFTARQNTPQWWGDYFPRPALLDHKYSRGHSLVISGPALATGASRLSARAALRTGSGLVTICGTRDALKEHASHLTSIMFTEADGTKEILKILEDERLNCIIAGPGLLPDGNTRELVNKILACDRATVLDAGALSAFEGRAQDLFDAIKLCENPVVLTPHIGEFRRLFPKIDDQLSKLDQVKMASEISGATVLLKGADTVVADPEGEVSISNNAPPWLASAGSGDVLAGIVGGLLAQKMPAFYAASAAAWLHGEAANIIGPALISEDMDQGLKAAISKLVAELER